MAAAITSSSDLFISATAVPIPSVYSYATSTSKASYATALSVGPTTTYAAPLASFAGLLGNQTYTTWGKVGSNETAGDQGKAYGQASWNDMWSLVSR